MCQLVSFRGAGMYVIYQIPLILQLLLPGKLCFSIVFKSHCTVTVLSLTEELVFKSAQLQTQI